MRRLYGPPRWRCHAFMHRSDFTCRRSSDSHDRRHRPGFSRTSGSGCVGRNRRRAVWLLSKRTNHVSRCTTQTHSKTNRSEYRGVNGWKPLPLRHLPAHSRSNQNSVGTDRERRRMMVDSFRPADQHELSRRSFLGVSFAAASGLFVSLYLDPDSIKKVLAQEGPQAPTQAKVYPPDAFV